LIRLLLGLAKPTAGGARVLGYDAATQGVKLREHVGYMPESESLPPGATAADFVGHMAEMSGLPARAARQRAADVLYQVGLDEERYRLIKGFSTGMKQRVKLAQAIVHDPQLVFLDEPTNGMDPQGREDMLDLIKRIRAELGVDVLVSTHLLGDVERICDHVIMVHAGRVLLQGSIVEAAGTASPGFGVQLGDNGEAVRDALAGAGLEVRQAGDELHVQGRDDAADLIRDLAAGKSWPLRRLVPKAPSLEETFLRLQATAAGEPAAPAPAPAGRAS
jgi:ABC-2 type transport system ATP-binding protein